MDTTTNKGHNTMDMNTLTADIFSDMKVLRLCEAVNAAEMLYKYNDAVQDVHGQVLRLGNRMTRLAADIENGCSINSLGELQNIDLDRACAVQAERRDAFRLVARGENVSENLIETLLANVAKRLTQ